MEGDVYLALKSRAHLLYFEQMFLRQYPAILGPTDNFQKWAAQNITTRTIIIIIVFIIIIVIVIIIINIIIIIIVIIVMSLFFADVIKSNNTPRIFAFIKFLSFLA